MKNTQEYKDYFYYVARQAEVVECVMKKLEASDVVIADLLGAINRLTRERDSARDTAITLEAELGRVL